MELISPLITKRGTLLPGTSSRLRRLGSSTYRPSSAGFSFSFNSSLQAGWVKSPVPTRWIPFLAAQKSRDSGVKSRLVAREYLE